MTEKSHPLGSGWLDEDLRKVDASNIAENGSLTKQERDRPLSYNWRTDAHLIASLPLPLAQGRMLDAVNSIVTEVMLAHEIGQWVSYSRRREFYAGLQRYFGTSYTYTTVLSAVEMLRECRLVDEIRAKSGDHLRTQHQSKIRATPLLVDLWRDAEARFELISFLRLKDIDGNLIGYQDTDLTRRHSREMEEINEYLGAIRFNVNANDGEVVGHHLLLDGAYYRPTAPLAYRVFTGGRWTLGGRVYWWGQSLRKDRRRSALINGEPLAEPDFRQLHPTMLYVGRGLEPPADAYDIRDVLPWATRDDGKIALNVLINSEAHQVVPALMKKAREQDRRTGEPKWTRTAGETRDIVDAVRERNAPIRDDLGSRAGPDLMYRDSRIILDTLKGCMRAGIPALPIHDSVLTPARYGGHVVEKMEAAFAKSFNGSKACVVRLSEDSIPHMPPGLSPPPASSLAGVMVGVAEAPAKAANCNTEPCSKKFVVSEIEIPAIEPAETRRPVQMTFIGLLDDDTPELEAIALLQKYEGGTLPTSVVRLIRDARRKRGVRQEDMARALGISRPQLANAEQQRFGLGRPAAARLRAWVADQDFKEADAA